MSAILWLLLRVHVHTLPGPGEQEQGCAFDGVSKLMQVVSCVVCCACTVTLSRCRPVSNCTALTQPQTFADVEHLSFPLLLLPLPHTRTARAHNQPQAPWMLSAIEVVTLLLLLLLLVVPTQPPGPYTFNFHASLEDLVLLGGLRAAAICGTYAYGSSSFHFRCVHFLVLLDVCAYGRKAGWGGRA